MAIFTGSANIGTTSANLCLVPPGPCMVVLSSNGTASPVWVGAGGTVVAGPATSGTVAGGNGFPLPSGAPVAIAAYQGDKGVQLVGVVSSGSASVGWIISSATGQTGF